MNPSSLGGGVRIGRGGGSVKCSVAGWEIQGQGKGYFDPNTVSTYVYCPWILDVATRIWRGRVSYSKFLQLHDSTNYKITLRSFMFWKYLMMSSSFACKKNSLSMNVIKQLFKNVCPILWLRRFLLRSSSLQEKFQMCSGTATPLPFHSSNLHRGSKCHFVLSPA